MRRRSILGVAILLALQACVVPQSRKTEADEAARAAFARCEAMRQSGALKTHLAVVDCAMPKVVAAYEQSAYPFEDLIYISLNARRIGAQKIDRGKATEAEVQRDLGELQTRVAAEERRRLDIIAYGGSPQPAAPDTLLQGLSTLTPMPSAAALAPAPSASSPTCFSFTAAKSCR